MNVDVLLKHKHTYTHLYKYFKLHIIIMCTEKVEFLADDIAGIFTWVQFPHFYSGGNFVCSIRNPFTLGRLSKMQG